MGAFEVLFSFKRVGLAVMSYPACLECPPSIAFHSSSPFHSSVRTPTVLVGTGRPVHIPIVLNLISTPHVG